MFGGDEGIRTLGLCVANASLSHLSYIPTQKAILDHLQKISTVFSPQRHRGHGEYLFLFFGRHRKTKRACPKTLEAVALRVADAVRWARAK
jgi:hypothetical protein